MNWSLNVRLSKSESMIQNTKKSAYCSRKSLDPCFSMLDLQTNPAGVMTGKKWA